MGWNRVSGLTCKYIEKSLQRSTGTDTLTRAIMIEVEKKWLTDDAVWIRTKDGREA